jgi:hypothetical protein
MEEDYRPQWCGGIWAVKGYVNSSFLYAIDFGHDTKKNVFEFILKKSY